MAKFHLRKPTIDETIYTLRSLPSTAWFCNLNDPRNRWLMENTGVTIGEMGRRRVRLWSIRTHPDSLTNYGDDGLCQMMNAAVGSIAQDAGVCIYINLASGSIPSTVEVWFSVNTGTDTERINPRITVELDKNKEIVALWLSSLYVSVHTAPPPVKASPKFMDYLRDELGINNSFTSFIS